MNFRGDYRAGEPYGRCDRCGVNFRLSELKVEWTNSKVCPRCYDIRPPQLTPPRINPREGAPIPGARPEPSIETEDSDLGFQFRDGTTYVPPT